MACSLYGIVARETPRAVILRRGGTNQVRLILWHTDTDEFEPGQWFKGKVHGALSDLSPDGTLLAYAAARSGGGDFAHANEFGYAWTAISRPPYFTALALWPAAKPQVPGGGVYDGGALFVDAKTLLLDHRAELTEPHPAFQPPKGLKVEVPEKPHFGLPDPSGEGTLTTEFFRMVRDGWRVIQRIRFEKSGRWASLAQPWVLEKTGPGGTYALVMRDDYNYQWGGVGRRYLLRDKTTGEEELLEGVQWAEWDHTGRLVFSKAGELFAAATGEDLTEATLLADFADQKFENVAPPGWATRW